MRLVYAIDNLDSGGAQRQAVGLALELHARPEVQVSFLIYRDRDFYGERLRDAGVPVVLVPKHFRWDPLLPWRMRSWLRRHRPDVVHAFLTMPSLWMSMAIRALPARDRPIFVAGERNAFTGDRASRSRERLCRRIYPLADAVAANASSVAREIAGWPGMDPGRVRSLPNGIDLDAWDAEAASDSPLELEAGRFHVALVGGLRRQKNHVLLLDALARIGPDRLKGWCIWFVGGRTGERGHAELVRARVDELGLGAFVRIVPPIRRVAAFMRRLDGLVLPSLHEGFPNVLLEAMASRVPVIASAVGEVPEMIDPGRTGFVLPRLRAEDLADALERLRALSSDERRQMGEAARRVVETRYTMHAVATRHLEFYRMLRHAGGPSGQGPSAR